MASRFFYIFFEVVARLRSETSTTFDKVNEMEKER